MVDQFSAAKTPDLQKYIKKHLTLAEDNVLYGIDESRSSVKMVLSEKAGMGRNASLL